MPQPFRIQNPTITVNDTSNPNAVFGKVKCRCRRYVTPTLYNGQLIIHKATINFVVMSNCLSYTPSGNHIGDGISFLQ